VLKRTFSIEIVWPKRPRSIPTLLSKVEVKQIVAHCRHEKYRTMLKVYYGCGLRLNELVHAKVEDIDRARKTLRIHNGKGNKDRDVVLTESVLHVYAPIGYIFGRRIGCFIPAGEWRFRWALRPCRRPFEKR